MKLLSTLLALVATTTPALADDTTANDSGASPPPAPAVAAASPGPRTLGVDGAVVVPLGGYSEVASIGVGALARFELPLSRGSLTARGGVVFNATNGNEADASLIMVPLYAGYRLPIGAGGGYVAGELGVTVIAVSVRTPLGTMGATSTDLGLTLGGGWRHGSLDIRGGIFAPDIGSSIGLMASVGYDFAKL
jgi:hypothetical protein